MYSRDIRLDFSANLNPLGMPKEVKEALVRSAEDFARYPDPDCTKLRQALSVYEQFPMERIVCGNGAADLIYRIVSAVHPKQALICAPSFCEYEKALLEFGSSVTYFYLREEENFAVSEKITEALTEETDICFICSPNNPVGNTVAPRLLERITECCYEKKILLVVDECFLPFVRNGTEKSAVRCMRENTVVLKAFTKIYAMAGIRLGYGLFGSGKMAARVQEAGQSWSVSGPAQTAGIAALTVDGYEEKTVSVIERERIYLDEELRAMGLRCYPAEADFLLFCVLRETEEGYKGRGLAERLLEKGTAIRSCENYEGLRRGYYRIAVKNHEENALLLEQIKECLSGEEEHAEVHA